MQVHAPRQPGSQKQWVLRLAPTVTQLALRSHPAVAICITGTQKLSLLPKALPNILKT